VPKVGEPEESGDDGDDNEDDNVRASASLDLPTDITTRDNPGREVDVHAHGNESNSVLVELMRQVSPLTSNEPEAILRFIANLDEVHGLGLCDYSFHYSHFTFRSRGCDAFVWGMFKGTKDLETM